MLSWRNEKWWENSCPSSRHEMRRNKTNENARCRSTASKWHVHRFHPRNNNARSTRCRLQQLNSHHYCFHQLLVKYWSYEGRERTQNNGCHRWEYLAKLSLLWILLERCQKQFSTLFIVFIKWSWGGLGGILRYFVLRGCH